MLIRRRARLVYQVTEGLRKRLSAELQERLKRSDEALEALETVLRAGPPESEAALKRQRDSLAQAHHDAAARLERVCGLASDSEISEGFVDFFSEVSVGDSEERLREAQIVIRDGVILEIRNG